MTMCLCTQIHSLLGQSYIYIYPDRLRSKLDKLYFIFPTVDFAGVLPRLPRESLPPDMRGEKGVLSREFQDRLWRGGWRRGSPSICSGSPIELGYDSQDPVLALGHFFEKYRSGLASHANSTCYREHNPEFADELECQILQTYYNQETIQRISLRYTMINRISSQRCSESREIYLSQRSQPLFPIFERPHDFYTLAASS